MWMITMKLRSLLTSDMFISRKPSAFSLVTELRGVPMNGPISSRKTESFEASGDWIENTIKVRATGSGVSETWMKPGAMY